MHYMHFVMKEDIEFLEIDRRKIEMIFQYVLFTFYMTHYLQKCFLLEIMFLKIVLIVINDRKLVGFLVIVWFAE